MYLEHFGLHQPPFRITPHTEFFFAGAKRGATLEALIYAIAHDEGIVKVSGEVGSGKTMLCRMLLEKLPDNVETIYLANPMLSRDEILFAIAEELRIPLTEGRSHLLLRSLQERLLEIYAAGRQVVALIDEAHAMPPEALEEIRLLSNLESNQHKLLQIVLFGQPELDDRLGQTSMRQLNDRITHNFRLEPLRRDDVSVYLMFRLRAAGYRGPDLFSTAALQLISKASEGLTRRINIIADKALLAAFSEGVHLVDRRQVQAAIRDTEFKRIGNHFGAWRRWAAATLGVFVISSVAYFAGQQHSISTPAATPIAAAQPITAALTAATPAAHPAASDASAALPSSATALALPAPEALPPALAPEASPTVAAPTAPSSEPRAGETENVLTLAERTAATEAWLEKTPDSHFFIQLLIADASSEKEVGDFLARNASTLDLQQLRVYRSNLRGRERLGVIYGDYPSRDQANAALATLGEIRGSSKPYVRSVGKLR
ncbi:AAA family ATPase [Accumulibacter sp.]|uniref:AAA family ATPase n=1 Tax=Accumulibacter sp. TaxID=2053492 RepID=UPI0028C3AB34|nr:AAA family ATPase [Accumulibacter sp.]